MTDTRILSPERIEEIRATLAKRLGDARRQAKKEHTRPYQVVLSMRDGDDVVTALAHVAALSEQVERLTATLAAIQSWRLSADLTPSQDGALAALATTPRTE